HHLAGLTGWEDIALVVLGLVLIGVELFVFPGFGVAGIAGLAALAGGFWLAMVDRDVRTPEASERAGWSVAVAMVAVIVGALLLLRFAPGAGRIGGLVLSTSLGDEPARPQRGPGRWLSLFGGGRELELAREERREPP